MSRKIGPQLASLHIPEAHGHGRVPASCIVPAPPCQSLAIRAERQGINEAGSRVEVTDVLAGSCVPQVDRAPPSPDQSLAVTAEGERCAFAGKAFWRIGLLFAAYVPELDLPLAATS